MVGMVLGISSSDKYEVLYESGSIFISEERMVRFGLELVGISSEK